MTSDTTFGGKCSMCGRTFKSLPPNDHVKAMMEKSYVRNPMIVFVCANCGYKWCSDCMPLVMRRISELNLNSSDVIRIGAGSDARCINCYDK